MATQKKTPTEPKSNMFADGMPTHEDAMREFGLDKVTYEACVELLFTSVGLPHPQSAPTTKKTEPARVTQVGPGLRDKPEESE